MNKKKNRNKRKNRKKKEEYPLEIEAAWYVLFQFISTFDYVIRYTDKDGKKQTKTANPNCVIAANMSKTNLLKPSPICKSDLKYHFNRDTIIFYKCDPNKKLSTGFGKFDKEALALSYSTYLNITTKRMNDKIYYVLLVGIDIDCHNGEKHVREVETLIKKYFPETYWEDSTNGKGRHGYLKIKFRNSYGVIKYITECLENIFSKLNELKNLYGYEADIDDPAGLPYIREFKDTNPYHKNWTTLYYKSGKESKFLGRHINRDSMIWYDYITYLRSNSFRVSRECYDSPAILNKRLSEDQIKESFSKFLSVNNISFPAPTKNKKYYKITVQRAFKLPMFGAIPSNHTDALPKMECIKEFYNLPYHTSSDLKTAYNQINIDIKNHVGTYNYSYSYNISGYYSFSDDINSTSSPVSELDLDEDPYSFPIPLKGEDMASSTHSRCSFVSETFTHPTEIDEIVPDLLSIKKGERKEIGYNCACTNTLNNTEKHTITYAEIIDWSEFYENKEFDIEEYWKNYKHNNRSNARGYAEIITDLKDEEDTMTRTALFIPAFINKIGREPTVDEAEIEYVRQGLNRNSAITSPNRRNRFKNCIGYYMDHYDESKKGFSTGWGKEKDEVLELIKPHIPEKLEYKQGKMTKPITLEELGYVYHIIRKMENSEQDYLLSNSLSYKRADELFEKEFGKKCGRHKFSGIKKILLKEDLIEKRANYKVGLRGNCYITTEDDE